MKPPSYSCEYHNGYFVAHLEYLGGFGGILVYLSDSGKISEYGRTPEVGDFDLEFGGSGKVVVVANDYGESILCHRHSLKVNVALHFS